MHIIPLDTFDREPNIEELLRGIDEKKLLKALRGFLGETAQILDKSGACILGDTENKEAVDKKIPLNLQLESVGYLTADDNEHNRSISNLLELLLQSSARYLMASDLHLEVVHADYEALQKKHDALTASEQQYKELAASLEQRVQEQVQTIENSQRQLYQAEKMASVGQLAAGVAHEINNPIGFINSNLRTAQQYVQDIVKIAQHVKVGADAKTLSEAWQEENLDFVLEDFESLLKESADGADRVTRIVADLKDFSNVDRTEEDVIDLNQVIRSVSNVATSQIGQKANVELDLGELPPMRCQPGHLGRVFFNMLLNSAQAMQEKHGEIHVSSQLNNNEVVVRIKDNGCGMSKELIERIFDPFFTTQDVGSGAGLGLTVSRDIIVTHEGNIEVESVEGKGTTFIIYLPVRK